MEVNIIFKTCISNIINKQRNIAHWWSKNSTDHTTFVAIACYNWSHHCGTSLPCPSMGVLILAMEHSLKSKHHSFYWPPSPWWEYLLTKTVKKWRFTGLHIQYRVLCCIETYLIHIYQMSKCSKCNWNRYIEGFCMWNVHFHINRLSPNIAYVILMSWPLMAIYFLLLNYWLFCG